MIYRAYRLNFWGDVLDQRMLICQSDQDAIEQARGLFGEDPVEVSVEVWLGPRRIARLTADDQP